MSSNSTGYGQEATRRPGVIYDQHIFPGHPLFAKGRPWGCSIDKKSGAPVGLIYPRGWKAPWMPPKGPEMFVLDKDDPTRFRLNYEWLLQERSNARREYEEKRIEAAVVRSWDPQDPEKQMALDLLVGKRKKLAPVEPVVACMQGDPWTLGATDVVNEKVAPFIVKPLRGAEAILANYPDFTAAPSLAEDIDALVDLEEQHDPDATGGGKRVPVKPKGKLAQLAQTLVGGS